MIEWYVTSSNNDEKYLKKVNDNIKDIMDIICEQFNSIQYSNDLKFDNILQKILDKSSILSIDKLKDDEFIIHLQLLDSEIPVNQL